MLLQCKDSETTCYTLYFNTWQSYIYLLAEQNTFLCSLMRLRVCTKHRRREGLMINDVIFKLNANSNMQILSTETICPSAVSVDKRSFVSIAWLVNSSRRSKILVVDWLTANVFYHLRRWLDNRSQIQLVCFLSCKSCFSSLVRRGK